MGDSGRVAVGSLSSRWVAENKRQRERDTARKIMQWETINIKSLCSGWLQNDMRRDVQSVSNGLTKDERGETWAAVPPED